MLKAFEYYFLLEYFIGVNDWPRPRNHFTLQKWSKGHIISHTYAYAWKYAWKNPNNRCFTRLRIYFKLSSLVKITKSYFVSGVCWAARGLPLEKADGGDLHHHPEKVSCGRDRRQLPGPGYRVFLCLCVGPRGLHHHGVHVGAQPAGAHRSHRAVRRGLQDRHRMQRRRPVLAQARLPHRQSPHSAWKFGKITPIYGSSTFYFNRLILLSPPAWTGKNIT